MPSPYPDITALIPHRPPFLFVDAIVSDGADNLVATKTWRPDEDFYRGHYPGAPITPGVLLCESIFQAGAAYLALHRPPGSTPSGVPLLVKAGEIRFRQPVLPGDAVTIEVKKTAELGGFIMMTGSMKKGAQRVLNVDFSVAWKEPAKA